MESLARLGRAGLPAVALLICASVPALAQADFCGLSVHVVSEKDDPNDTQVTILDFSSGTILGIVPTERGVAEYCDTGFGALQIRVPFCTAVQNRAIAPDWRRTMDVTVTLTESACRVIFPVIIDYLPSGCQFLLRVRDEKGAPIVGAHLRGGEPTTSDRFGRLYHFDRMKTQQAVIVDAPGMEPKAVNLDCSVRIFDKEVPITLTRLGPQQ